jgi:hypothetical protein
MALLNGRHFSFMRQIFSITCPFMQRSFVLKAEQICLNKKSKVMKEFMMIFRHEQAPGGAMPTEEQMQAVMSQWREWIAGIAAKGKYSGTNRLLPQGQTLKPENVITDGPYVEAKEMVGGYVIVKADSLGEAVEMAKACPNLLYGGSVEVRSVMAIDDNAKSESFLQAKGQ